jgi:hypothetical protein
MPLNVFLQLSRGFCPEKGAKKSTLVNPYSHYSNLILFDSVFCYIKQNPSLKNSGTGVVRS